MPMTIILCVLYVSFKLESQSTAWSSCDLTRVSGWLSVTCHS